MGGGGVMLGGIGLCFNTLALSPSLKMHVIFFYGVVYGVEYSN